MKNYINGIMWVFLGLTMIVVDFVTAIDPETTMIISNSRPDQIDNGYAIYNEVGHLWYNISTFANVMGVVFILGGLALIGVTIYEKHRYKQV